MSAAVGGRGGIERVTTLVVGEMRERGHHVAIHLFGPSRNPGWEENLEESYVGPQQRHSNFVCRWLHVLWWATGSIRAFDPDLVIGMTPSALVVSRVVRLLIRSRYQIWSWLHEAMSQLEHGWGVRWADAHLAISTGLGQDIAETVGASDNVYVVYNPTVPAPIQPRPGLNDGVHFVYIGRLDNSVKRIEDILLALSSIREPWRLTIVGDGEDRHILVDLAARLHISDSVQWVGWSHDPWSAAGTVSALILASISEGFGVVLAEALTRGVPVVASDCHHGPRDIVLPNLNGWLYPPGDVAALQAILLRIVKDPYQLPDPYTVKATAARFYLARVVDRMLDAVTTFTATISS